jgi:putative ABC transport system permease protein
MTLRDLKLRLRALVAPRTVEREMSGELAFHIECETRKHVENGVEPAEARRLALSRFGSVPLIADECRDERGIAFFVTLARDLAFALRTHRRAPLVPLTVVSTIALGLGVVAVAFTFFNHFFFRVDAVRNPEELFSVEGPVHPGSSDEIPSLEPSSRRCAAILMCS